MKKIILVILLLLLTACTTENGTSGDVTPSPGPLITNGQTTSPSPSNSNGDDIAMRIGDIEITSNEYRYQYYSAVQSIISYYGDILGIDSNVPFEQQYFDETTTWADFFAEQAIAGTRNAVLLSEQATKMGMTLDEVYDAQITEYINYVKEYCETNNTTLEQWLKDNYGGNMDEQKLREIMERTYLGYQFEMYKRGSVDVSDSVILDYYNRNSADFDSADYLSYMFETAEEAEACLAAITDEASFYSYMAENFDENMDDYRVIGESNTGDEFSEWLYDRARVEGDTVIIEAYDVYVVLYFIRCYQPDDTTLSIRHVLISSDGISAEEARAKAETLYEEWKSGAATEDTFAELAANNSEDPGSVNNGGLYEDVYEGQMVQTFNDWCFDPARKPGDSGLVDTDFGTHIMYYVGSVLSWKSQVKQAIIEGDYSEFYESLLSQYEVEQLNMDVSK